MLSLRALEENDRVAKRISKRGCKSGGVILTLGRSTRALVCRAPCPLFALAISPCFIARAIKITRLGWPTTFRALLPSFDPRYVSYVQICIYCIIYLYIYIYRHNVEDFRLRDKRLYSRATRNTASIYW